MNFKFNRYHIEVYADSEIDRAYIEDTLGLRKDGDYLPLVRQNTSNMFMRLVSMQVSNKSPAKNVFDEFDFETYVGNLKEWIWQVFGPDSHSQTKRITDHARKELLEIEKTPLDILEWVDLMMLAIHGALRAGYDGHGIGKALEKKLAINKERKWPAWQDKKPDEVIEHVRDEVPPR